MRVRQRISFAFAAVLAGCIGMVVLAWFGAFTPSAPSGWGQIHLGMGRDAVLALAGTPKNSGWPEKVVEIWERNGVVCRHRLLVAYQAQQRGDGKVESVYEGTWLRGYGWLHPRKELK